MNRKVSVIIVNFNTETLLDTCIESILDKTQNTDYEIIVVDNNSEKASLDAVVQKYPSVIFHFLDENIGFGRANNEGVKLATGDYLFFVNPDTIFLNNATKILSDYMQQHADVGVCGGNLYRDDLSPAVSYFYMTFLRREYYILFNKKYTFGFNSTDTPIEALAVMGADLFISQSLFRECGGFDPDFFMYFEEIYLCDKVRKAGYKIMCVPDAKIIHLEGGAGENKTEELNKWSYQERWYSKFVYLSKQEGKLQASILYYANIAKLKLAWTIYSIKKDAKKIAYWENKHRILQQTYSRYKKQLSVNSEPIN